MMNIDEAIENLNQAVKWLEEALTPREERWAVAAREEWRYGELVYFLAANKNMVVYMTSPTGGGKQDIKLMSKDEAITVARVLGHRAVRVDENFNIGEEVNV